MLRRVLTYAVLILAAAGAAHADTGTILIFPFENLSNDRSLDWIGEGIAELMVERLQPEAAVYVFTRDERLQSYEKLGIPENTLVSRATQLKLGWETGADKIVTGSYSGTAEEFQIAARFVDMDFSRASEEVTVRGKLQDVISLSVELAGKLAPGSSTPPAHPQSAFENYIRGILNSDAQKQISFFETAIRQDSGYTAALLELGRVYHLERDFANSNRWLEQIARLGPERLRAQFLMGLNYFYMGDHARSMAVFQQLPSTYDVLLNLGTAASQKGDFASAMAAWTRAPEMDPLKSDVFFNIGYANLLKGEAETAAKNLNESLNLRGHDSEALFLLGRAYERLGRIEESQRLIAQAARLSQRVERWATQPLPKLERLSTTTAFTNGTEIWTDQRLARRAKGHGLTLLLEFAQNQIDAYMYGEAVRELQHAIRVFPDSTDARMLLDEVNRQRTTR